MIWIGWNIVLALTWAALQGDFTPPTLITGVLVGSLVLWLTRATRGQPRPALRPIRFLAILPFFIYELVLSNLRIARQVITPRHTMRPGIVAVPLDVTTDAEITWLANLITLTPGTLSLDVSKDRKTIYIHAMNVPDVEAFRREIKQGFERRVMEMWR